MLTVECLEESEMDVPCPSQEQVLAELHKLSPDAPFLALGQTVFWDEPMKAGVAKRSMELGYHRRFIAGVHDTDYFAKFHQSGTNGGYKALPHNDTTTKGLWSAAGEFSALFGSETVITKETLQHAGAKLGRIQAERPGYLDEITEAMGWRGVVSLHPESRITAEKPLAPLFRELYDTFDWAVTRSLDSIAGPHHKESLEQGDRLRTIACEAAEGAETATLSNYYQKLVPEMYATVLGEPIDVDSTSTTELLKFNSETCHLPRFDLFGVFLAPESRQLACSAYDKAVAGSETYTLDRFGVGALPFDLFVPGIGRGTLRLGSRGGLIMAPTPAGFSYKKPPETVAELAAILEKRFGSHCVLVGKAVTLIGMLAREHVFVFHEGASSYVHRSRKLHQALAAGGHGLALNPVLRIRHEPWDALDDCCAWFKLPEPLRRPFGVDEVSGCSFSARWRIVGQEQRTVLETLAGLDRPLDLVRYLHSAVGGQWNCLASQYENLHQAMVTINAEVAEVRTLKALSIEKLRQATKDRVRAEIKKGEHWRARIFEKEPSAEDWEERERLTLAVTECIQKIASAKREWRELQASQDSIVNSPEAEKGRTLRRNIALEAELTRAKLIREAVIASTGLEHAGHRPAAWWFPLVCPDGTWFRATMRAARYELEPLT